jgi:hypothetical protein
MNTHRTRTTPTASLTGLSLSGLTLSGLAAAALVGIGAPSAAADVGSGSCSETLSRAAEFPGRTTVDGRSVRLHSDAYDLYLSRQAPCAPTTSPTDCHHGPFLVVRAC